MRYLKVLLLLFAISFSLTTPVQSQDVQKFEYICYDDPQNPYTLYFEVMTPCISVEGSTVSQGTCRLISPEKYESTENNELSFPENATAYTGTVNIPCSVESQTEMTPGTFKVVEIDGKAFSQSTVSSVSIPATLTTINEGAFSTCGTLTSVTVDDDNPYYSSADGVLYNKDQTTLEQVPGGMTSYELPAFVNTIEGKAFYGLENLAEIKVEEGNEDFEVDNGILYKKDGEGNKEDIVYVPAATEDLIIPEGITKLGANLIFNCYKNIKTINIPASVTNIDVEFFNCPKLTTITVNSSNQEYASGNGGLIELSSNTLLCCPPAKTSFDVPDGVELINYSALYNCDKLESLSFSKSVTYIPEFILYRCSALKTITVDAENPNYMGANGALIKKSGNVLICCPPAKTSFDVPDGVESIGDMAFYSCIYLTEINISATVKKVNCDFVECKLLETIGVDAGNQYFASENGGLVQKNGKVLLCCPSAKKSFVIPNDIMELGYYAFNNCVHLTTITIPTSVQAISSGSFDGCTSLEAFIVEEGSSYFSTFDDVLFDKEQHTLYKCPAKKELLTLTYLPEIIGGAFSDFNGKFVINITDADKPFVKEGAGFSAPNNTEITYYRTLEAGKLGTITLFFFPDNFDDFYFYKLTATNDTKLFFTRVTREEFTTATPYIYKNANDGNIATKMTNTTEDYLDTFIWEPTCDDWKFTPTFTSIELVGTEFYVLKDNTLKSSSVKVTVSPFRGYLTHKGANAAKNIDIFLDGEPTGITLSDIDNDASPNSNEARYNLAGQKVSDAYKGIVISNGKKYLSK